MQKSDMKRILAQIPNTITSLNLVSGVAATFFAIDGHLVWAAIFICFAAVLDFMDGFAARLLKAYSEIGKELDSLADVVSFGVAPGAILFTLIELRCPIHLSYVCPCGRLWANPGLRKQSPLKKTFIMQRFK